MKRLVIVLAAVLLFACGGNKRGTGDSPVDQSKIDDSPPAHIVNFPDQFMNVAQKCIGPNGVYSHTRAAPPVVIPNDPLCTDK